MESETTEVKVEEIKLELGKLDLKGSFREKHVTEKIRELDEKLKYDRAAGKAKWEWDKTVIDGIRTWARDILPGVRKEFDDVLEELPKGTKGAVINAFKDPTHFQKLNERPGEAGKWFEHEEFLQYRTEYGFTDTWDKEPLRVLFLRHRELKEEEPVKVLVRIHGGGYWTGSYDHEGWFPKNTLVQAKQNNAIIISPDYRLGPGNLQDIVDDLAEFWRYYWENKNWQEKVKTILKIRSANIHTKRLLIAGDSAGGHAAVLSWYEGRRLLSNPEDFQIRALLLQYPMLAHYKRTFPSERDSKIERDSDKDRVESMGATMTRSWVEKRAEAIDKKAKELEERGVLPAYTSAYAPRRMIASSILSLTGKWQEMMQRAHEGDERNYTNDCLDLAREREPPSKPKIFIYHGHDDPNCPFDHVLEFEKSLREKWGYNDNNIWVKKVTRLDSKEQQNDVVGHGFDHTLDSNKEPFLKETNAKILGAW